MYAPVKDFLDIDTWHTGHPLDMERFYIALSKVINDSNFHPGKLKDYMLKEMNLIDENEDNSFVKTINKLTNEAYVIYV